MSLISNIKTLLSTLTQHTNISVKTQKLEAFEPEKNTYYKFDDVVKFDLTEAVVKSSLTGTPVLLYNKDYDLYFFYYKDNLYDYKSFVTLMLCKKITTDYDKINYSSLGIEKCDLNFTYFDYNETLRFIDKRNSIEVNIVE